jgi:ATP-binding cassette, subfamily B, bacterial CvaB/MchF/RaxB
MARKLPIILQSERAECGLACLAMIAAHYGHEQSMASLRRQYVIGARGVDLNHMVSLAGRLGFQARGLRLDPEQLAELRTPAILHWNLNHFVVLSKVNKHGIEIHDPSVGKRQIGARELDASFSGIALELQPSSDFRPAKQAAPSVSIRWMLQIDGLGKLLMQVLLIALAMEIATIAMPIGMQFLLDSVLISRDSNDLALVCAALATLMLFQTALGIARAWMVASSSSQINAQWTNQLFAHLLKLPVRYFESRPLGLITQKFASLQFVERVLSNSFVESILDGLTATVVLLLLFAYSPIMTLVVLIFSLAYVSIRALTFNWSYRQESERLVFTAYQSTYSIEAIRSIATIKLANAEQLWAARIANLSAEIATRNANQQGITASIGAFGKLVFATQRLCLLGIGGWLAIHSGFTAGKLIAFVAFGDLFVTRAAAFVDHWIDFKMLRMHFQHIAEIADELPEQSGIGAHALDSTQTQIEVSNLGFRYDENSPWIIRNLSFTISDGELVAFVGPSGCGKTTLAKLLLGLYQPSEGVIRIGGRDVRHIALADRRALFASVLQEDALFSGSIADNISNFAPDATLANIKEAADAAMIHDAINAMPMGYESVVGDNGSGVSGGQKQRLLLARALYRRAPVLLLDEATSHLDVATEIAVNHNIAALKQTRIVIAHRPNTIAAADRVIQIGSHLAIDSTSMSQFIAATTQHSMPKASLPAVETVS